MKSFSQYLSESLTQVKLDSEQLYKLYSNEIDVKTFAVNNDITNDDASKIEDILKSKSLYIISTDEIRERYSNDEVECLDDMQALEDLGIRYGNELDLSPEEKKQREQAKKHLGIIDDNKPNQSTDKSDDDSKKIDDEELICHVITDIVNAQLNRVTEYFWKKSGDVGYLFIIIDVTPEMDKFLKKL